MPGLEDGRHVGNGEGAGGDSQEERSDPPGVTSVRFPPARHPLPKTCAARQAAGRSSCPARRGLLRSRAKTPAGLPPVAGPRVHSDNRGRVPSAACTRPSNIPSRRLYRPGTVEVLRLQSSRSERTWRIQSDTIHEIRFSCGRPAQSRMRRPTLTLWSND